MDLYREEILEHWRSPQNFRVLAGADLVVEQINPLCGDQVTFYFKIFKKQSRGVNVLHPRGAKLESDGMIEDASFVGKGCAISIASASILSEFIKGMRISKLSKMTGEEVLDLIGGSITPARLKCAFLPLEAIKKLKIAN